MPKSLRLNHSWRSGCAASQHIRETERAARNPGLPSHRPPTDLASVGYCRRQVSRLVAEHGLPSTMDDLLETVAPCLDVDIVEIRSDDDMRSLPRRVHPSEEPAMRVWIYSEGALDPTARLYGSGNTRLTQQQRHGRGPRAAQLGMEATSSSGFYLLDVTAGMLPEQRHARAARRGRRDAVGLRS